MSRPPQPRTSRKIALPKRDPSSNGPSAIRAEMAGYLFLRAAKRQHVEGADLADLENGQKALELTREALNHGRGNVKSDSPAAIVRMVAARTLMTRKIPAGPAFEQLFGGRTDAVAQTAKAAATAMFTKAGNCGEHSIVAAAMLGAVMEPDQSAQLVSDLHKDHAWTELARYPASEQRHPDNVVVDPWADGPAIFAEDGKYSSEYDPVVLASFSSLEAKDILAEAQKGVAALAGFTSPSEAVNETYARNLRPSAPEWTPEPVLDQYSASYDLYHLEKSRDKETIGLRKEILAAGVARSLGANVANAAAIAPEIIKEAYTLSGKKIT
ncbi:hypothetical protein G3N58_03965 [Paraburkholderia sp. Ac-20342]|uniref:hypothetical protein n=1 Tax=unclassified Paraburkholderia TaxID=2615204 RepID=UPI001423D41A|nr:MULTISPECIES: hypothetical protein [unclassified Paraburkholderia]MBN3845989.1 hypothetical protein [Paraburkholderia sp. Ac-20342]NIF77759.1 hypothetical protein [Paraburkholderia sp. Cy-641]